MLASGHVCLEFQRGSLSSGCGPSGGAAGGRRQVIEVARVVAAEFGFQVEGARAVELMWSCCLSVSPLKRHRRATW